MKREYKKNPWNNCWPDIEKEVKKHYLGWGGPEDWKPGCYHFYKAGPTELAVEIEKAFNIRHKKKV